MKKAIKTLALALSLSLVLGACGNKNDEAYNNDKDNVKTEEKQSSPNVDDKITELANK